MATWIELPKEIREEIIKKVANDEAKGPHPMLQRFAYGVYIRKYQELEFLLNIDT
jgi:hypothetical protein